MCYMCVGTEKRKIYSNFLRVKNFLIGIIYCAKRSLGIVIYLIFVMFIIKDLYSYYFTFKNIDASIGSR